MLDVNDNIKDQLEECFGQIDVNEDDGNINQELLKVSVGEAYKMVKMVKKF